MSGINYSEIILDEICLEGLDGITLQALWIRLTDRLDLEVPEPMKRRFWKIITLLKDVDIFELPEARPPLLPFYRYNKIDGTWVIKDDIEDNRPIDIYPFFPVKDGCGSCKDFHTRVNISDKVKSSTYDEVIKNYNRKLVIVGTLDARWRSLAPSISPAIYSEFTPIQYSLLERIGRARSNGEITIGRFSLVSLAVDPRSLFYHRKPLMRLKLITKQFMNFKGSSTKNHCLLLHLTRFFKPSRAKLETVTEAVVEFVKKCPENRAHFSDVSEFVKANDFAIKTLLKSPCFFRKFKDMRIPYRELHPDAIKSEYSAANGTEKTLRMIKWVDDIENTQDDQDQDEYEVTGSGYLGEGLLHQAHAFIYSQGSVGATQRQVGRALGSEALVARLACRYLTSYNLVHVVMDDRKRQRMAKYVSQAFVGTIDKIFQEEKDKMKTLFQSEGNKPEIKIENISSLINKPTSDISSIPSVSNESNIPFISDLMPIGFPIDNKNLKDSMTSLKQMRRVNFIMEQLHRHHVIHNISNLLKICARQEAARGDCNGTIDKRSLMRLLGKLDREGQLKLLRVRIGVIPNQSTLTFVCEKNIEPSHHSIQSIVEQTRFINKSAVPTPASRTVMSNKKPIDISKLYGYVPKFARMRVLHKLLFYLTYEHQEEKGDKEKLISKSLLLEDVSKNELSDVYSHAPDKYIFVPPMYKHVNWPRGWILLCDVIFNMPLCIFLKLVNIPCVVPGLLDYLKHPIKSQILVKNLPGDLRNILLRRRRYAFSIHKIVQHLCLFGLMKFGDQIAKEKDKVMIYVNKCASALDTTTSKLGYNQIEDKEYYREMFSLESLGDLKRYWVRMETICLNTPLGVRQTAIGKQDTYQEPDSKLCYILKNHKLDEVNELDTGEIPGDRMGAGGLDSSFYAHLKRSWSYITIAEGIKTIKRKIAEKTATEQAKTTAHPLKKRSIIKRNVPTNTGTTRKGKYIVRTVLPRENKKRKQPFYDDVDKRALKLLGKQRTSWQPREDRLLLLMRAASHIVFPNIRLVSYTLVRDIMHAGARSYDKTSRACQRRILFLVKNHLTARSIEISIADATQNQKFKSLYLNLYSRIRIPEASKEYPEYKRQLNIHFIELVHYLYRRMYGKDGGTKALDMLPNSLSEFMKKFRIARPVDSPKPKIQEPQNTKAIRGDILGCIIHSALCCARDKRSRSIQLLQLYRNFSESLLRSTVQHIKTSGMISLNKPCKTVRTQAPYTSYFNLSQNYSYRLCGLVPYKMFSEATDLLKIIINDPTGKSVPKSLNTGTTLTLIELKLSDRLTLELDIPDELIIIDPLKKESAQSHSNNSSPETTKASGLGAAPSRISLSALEVVDGPGPTQHLHESFVVNTCNLHTIITCPPEEILKVVPKKYDEIIDKVISDGLLNVDILMKNEIFSTTSEKDFNLTLMKEIIDFIDEKTYIGVNAEDLKVKFSSTLKEEIERIVIYLMKELVIRRVGTIQTRWILLKYSRCWFININGTGQPEEDTWLFEQLDDGEVDNDTLGVSDASDGMDTQNVTTEISKNRKRKRCSSSEDSSPRESKRESMNTDDSSKDQTQSLLAPIDIFNINPGDRKRKLPFEDDVVPSKREKDYDGSAVDETVLMSPRPWLRPDGSLNMRVLCRWAGALICHMLGHPVITLQLLQKRFAYMIPYHITLLVEMLSELGCARLFVIRKKKPTLWSGDRDSELKIEPATCLDSNEEIHIELPENSILNFAAFKSYALSKVI